MLTRELMLEAKERAFSIQVLTEIGLDPLMVADIYHDALRAIYRHTPEEQHASYIFNVGLSLGIIAGRLEFANGLEGSDYPDG